MPTDGWEYRRIGDVLSRVRKPVEVEKDTRYREIGIRSHGRGLFHKDEVIGKALGNKSVFWIEPNCLVLNIVFAWEQAIAKTTYKEEGFIGSHRFPQFKPKNNRVDIDYLVYFFNTLRGKHLLGLASPGGAGRNKTLGQKDFANTKLLLPPLPEQQKIVRILSTWDNAIKTVEKLIVNGRQQKKALMQRLLTGKERLPGFQDKWKIKPLKKMTKIYDGTHITPNYKASGVPFYSVEQITNDDFVKTKYISEDVFEKESKRVKIEKNDILMTRIGDIGTAKLIDWDVRASFYVSLALIKGNGSFNSEYLAHYINSSNFQKELYKRTIHLAFPKKINLGEIGKCLIALPSPEEQKRIAEIFTKMDTQIRLFKDELNKLQTAKKALMQQLLTGKRRVKLNQ